MFVVCSYPSFANEDENKTIKTSQRSVSPAGIDKNLLMANDLVMSKFPEVTSWDGEAPEVISKLLSDVDKCIEMLNDTSKIFFMTSILFTAGQIENKVHLRMINAHGTNYVTHLKNDVKVIASTTSDLLSAKRYEDLEKAALKALDSKDQKTVNTSIRLLTKTLASQKALIVLSKLYKESQPDPDGLNYDLEMINVFHLAEGLAYLKSNEGVGVLIFVLESKLTSLEIKRSAIKALEFLHTKLPNELLQKLMLSELSGVSREAFRHAGFNDASRFIVTNAITRYEMLYNSYRNASDLEKSQIDLLYTISVVLIEGYGVQETLTNEEMSTVRRITKEFLLSSNHRIQFAASPLFKVTGGSDDIDLIKTLLDSKNDTIRSEAVLALRNCTQEQIRENSQRLLEMLDLTDKKDKWERSCALCTLKIGLGEKSRMLYPDDEFELEIERVKKAYEDLK